MLSLKDNRLATKAGGKALAQALANNSTLKELDVSSNVWKEYGNYKGDGPGFAQELAVGIKDNGGMTSLNLASNQLCGLNMFGKGTYDASGNSLLDTFLAATLTYFTYPI